MPQEDPLDTYRLLRRDGTLKPDTCQELAIEKLQLLHCALRNYRPSQGTGGWRARLGLARRPRADAPQGLYIYGGVGRGKSMLMDLFYRHTPMAHSRRVHFHEFMDDVHTRLHRLRRNTEGRQDDLIQAVAQELADEAWLLCFDEFHVVDIADAMILGRLFTALFELGVVVVATSNWAPDDLYKDGLQRNLFLPFIALLKQRLDVLAIAEGSDYRLARLHGRKVYYQPLGERANQGLRAVFHDLTDGEEPEATELLLKGRTIPVPKAVRNVAWFTFEELCARPLGAADYIAIATHYDAVIVDGVPRFTEAKRNEAKRFITLVDTFYEHRVCLVLAADAPPERLHIGDTHAFEFERTVSRLMEMQSADYLASQHLT
ncbi:MAG: AFG1 family ATPase [Rhodospirillaceae bacterium]|nr:AFG1 family ATPase [Rhodospirillaceae bacterium]MCA8931253.1 AFG1 family ATPase [Rhodospirillaceae bacterium]